jgi:hypothetical protein
MSDENETYSLCGNGYVTPNSMLLIGCCQMQQVTGMLQQGKQGTPHRCGL